MKAGTSYSSSKGEMKSSRPSAEGIVASVSASGALVRGLAEIRSDAILRAIWDSPSPDGLVAEIFTEPAGIAWTRQVLARAVERAGWSEADANAAIEFFLRIALSLLISIQPERTDEELRAFLYRYLIPGLGLAASEEIRAKGAAP